MKSNDETGGSRRHTRGKYKPVDREHSLSVSTISSSATYDESELNVAVSTTYKRNTGCRGFMQCSQVNVNTFHSRHCRMLNSPTTPTLVV